MDLGSSQWPGCRQESEYLLCSLFLYSYKELSLVWGQLFSSCAESWESGSGQPGCCPSKPRSDVILKLSLCVLTSEMGLQNLPCQSFED